jgi:pyruvate dehydrogenase (quinone)
MELVMPPHTEVGQVAGMALYSVKAILTGRGRDVVDMLESNFVK